MRADKSTSKGKREYLMENEAIKGEIKQAVAELLEGLKNNFSSDATHYPLCLPVILDAAKEYQLPLRATSVLQGEQFWTQSIGDKIGQETKPEDERIWIVSSPEEFDRLRPHLQEHSQHYTTKVVSIPMLEEAGIQPVDILLIGNKLAGGYKSKGNTRSLYLSGERTLLNKSQVHYERIRNISLDYSPEKEAIITAELWGPGPHRPVQPPPLYSPGPHRPVQPPPGPDKGQSPRKGTRGRGVRRTIKKGVR